MKRFMYGSLGILALALAFHLGAMTTEEPQPVVASIVDHTASGIVAFVPVSGGTPRCFVLDEVGEVWEVGATLEWTRKPEADPPVPISDITFWSTWVLVADNEVWAYTPGMWENKGPWPGGPTRAEKTTWSNLKTEFN